ncbi:MAG: hypothetical protein E6G92_09385 [Alphaproteobacteria bacterium]|nr:MAG: hypothetical protein E6G92_09385 [Alphaproteobacteria bacterium]
MNRRRLICCAILLALLAPGPLLATITVKSSTALEFWIIRQDIMINTARTAADQRRLIGGNSPYGPWPIGTPRRAKPGATYVAFPACGPNREIKSERWQLVEAAVNPAANTNVNVECN